MENIMKRLNIPSYANNLGNRLSSLLSGEITSELNEKLIYGVILASAYATNNKFIIKDILEVVREYVDATTIDMVMSAAALTSTNFNHKDLPCLESEITIENADKEYISTSHTPYTQVSEINNDKTDDLDFQIYLMAASFIADFDRHIDIRTQLIQGKSVSDNSIRIIINVAATIQSISELIEIDNKKMKRILVVDDEVRMTRMLKLTLEKQGKFEVRTENKGSNAVAAARSFKPDLILLDIIMPDMGGEDIAAKIKEDEKLSNVKIIFLTSLLTNDETGSKGKKIGRFVFLAKPVRADDLIYCIENQINNAIATV
jgi:CheY-like chemotaxis protein